MSDKTSKNPLLTALKWKRFFFLLLLLLLTFGATFFYLKDEKAQNQTFDLIQKKDSKVKELSDFEKYLLALARTTVRKVDILLVDNIFDYLNEEEGNLLLSKIKELYYNENDICIFSSEEESKVLKFEARVVKLNNGVIVGEE